MYLVIGLTRDGKLKLVGVFGNRPSPGHLESLAAEYTQLLVVGGAGAYEARFEIHSSPLWQVELA